jgi:hypothetical protein
MRTTIFINGDETRYRGLRRVYQLGCGGACEMQRYFVNAARCSPGVRRVEHLQPRQRIHIQSAKSSFTHVRQNVLSVAKLQLREFHHGFVTLQPYLIAVTALFYSRLQPYCIAVTALFYSRTRQREKRKTEDTLTTIVRVRMLQRTGQK